MNKVLINPNVYPCDNLSDLLLDFLNFRFQNPKKNQL